MSFALGGKGCDLLMDEVGTALQRGGRCTCSYYVRLLHCQQLAIAPHKAFSCFANTSSLQRTGQGRLPFVRCAYTLSPHFRRTTAVTQHPSQDLGQHKTANETYFRIHDPGILVLNMLDTTLA